MLDFLTSCFRNYKIRRSLRWHHFCNMSYLVCHIYPYLVMFWWLKLWDYDLSSAASAPAKIAFAEPILRWKIFHGNFLSRRNFSKTQFVSVDNLTRKMGRTSEKFNPTSISLVNAEDKGIFFQLDKCIGKQNLLVLMRLFSCLMDLSVSNAHVVINNFQKNIYNLAKSTDVKILPVLP